MGSSKKIRGIRADRKGFRAYVRVGSVLKLKRFPADTPMTKMQDWRAETRLALQKLPQAPPRAGSL
jgi:hypothetical protein